MKSGDGRLVGKQRISGEKTSVRSHGRNIPVVVAVVLCKEPRYRIRLMQAKAQCRLAVLVCLGAVAVLPVAAFCTASAGASLDTLISAPALVDVSLPAVLESHLVLGPRRAFWCCASCLDLEELAPGLICVDMC